MTNKQMKKMIDELYNKAIEYGNPYSNKFQTKRDSFIMGAFYIIENYIKLKNKKPDHE